MGQVVSAVSRGTKVKKQMNIPVKHKTEVSNIYSIVI